MSYSYTYGTGTLGDPYQIWKIEDLNGIRDYLSSHFSLEADLDFESDSSYYNSANKTNYISGSGWDPIGDSTNGGRFFGTLKGNGYKIKNLYINRSGGYLALFAHVVMVSGENTYFKAQDLDILDASVTSTDNQNVLGIYAGHINITSTSFETFRGISHVNVSGTITGGSNVGGLYGWGGCTTYRCSADVTINSNGRMVGGLIGQFTNGHVAIECYSKGAVTSTSTSTTSQIGGLIGRMATGTQTIRDCFSFVDVVSSGRVVGGLIGQGRVDTDTVVENCFCVGSVTGGHATLNVGSFVGNTSTCEYINNYYDTTVSGRTDTKGALPRTTAEMKESTIPGNYENTPIYVDWNHNVWYQGTDEEYPYFGWQAPVLEYDYGPNINGYFQGHVLNIEGTGATYDFNTTTSKHPLWGNAVLKTVNISSDITTIGDYCFTDSKIIDLNMSNDVVSIKNYAFWMNEIKNIKLSSGLTTIGHSAFRDNKLESISVPAQVTSIDPYAFADNNISDMELPESFTTIPTDTFRNNNFTRLDIRSHYTSVSGGAFADNAITLIRVRGENVDFSSSDCVGDLSSSFNSFYVENDKLVGFYIYDTPTETWNYTSGDIEAALITDSYSILDAKAFNPNINADIINDNHKILEFTTESASLGVLLSSHKVKNLEPSVPPQVQPILSAHTILEAVTRDFSLDLIPIKDRYEIKAADTANTVVVGTTTEKHTLTYIYAQPPYPYQYGSGTEEDPYLIYYLDDLDGMRYFLTSHFKIMRDLDFFNIEHYKNLDNIIRFVDGNGWEPLGNSDHRFKGFVDGNNKKIENLYINRYGEENIGLFGIFGHNSNESRLKNIRIINPYVIGGRYTGSLVGRVIGNSDTSINQCSVWGGFVEGSGATGGLVGGLNAYSSTITGLGNPSLNEGSAFTNVFYDGYGDGDRFGGLVGCNRRGTIKNSRSRGIVFHNSGAPAHPMMIGGLVGDVSDSGRVELSYSTTELIVGSDRTYVGGLVGNRVGGSWDGFVSYSYWDKEASGITISYGGSGRTTQEMLTGAIGGNTIYASWSNDIWFYMGDERYPELRWEQSYFPVHFYQSHTINKLKNAETTVGGALFCKYMLADHSRILQKTIKELVSRYGLKDLENIGTINLDKLAIHRCKVSSIDYVNILKLSNIFKFSSDVKTINAAIVILSSNLSEKEKIYSSFDGVVRLEEIKEKYKLQNIVLPEVLELAASKESHLTNEVVLPTVIGPSYIKSLQTIKKINAAVFRWLGRFDTKHKQIKLAGALVQPGPATKQSHFISKPNSVSVVSQGAVVTNHKTNTILLVVPAFSNLLLTKHNIEELSTIEVVSLPNIDEASKIYKINPGVSRFLGKLNSKYSTKAGRPVEYVYGETLFSKFDIRGFDNVDVMSASPMLTSYLIKSRVADIKSFGELKDSYCVSMARPVFALLGGRLNSKTKLYKLRQANTTIGGLINSSHLINKWHYFGAATILPTGSKHKAVELKPVDFMNLSFVKDSTMLRARYVSIVFPKIVLDRSQLKEASILSHFKNTLVSGIYIINNLEGDIVYNPAASDSYLIRR